MPLFDVPFWQIGNILHLFYVFLSPCLGYVIIPLHRQKNDLKVMMSIIEIYNFYQLLHKST